MPWDDDLSGRLREYRSSSRLSTLMIHAQKPQRNRKNPRQIPMIMPGPWRESGPGGHLDVKVAELAVRHGASGR